MSAGTSSGGRQSAILIPVPQAEPLVGRYRMEYDPVAASGVPAHITLIVPWLAPDDIADSDLHALGETLRGFGAFDFRLRDACWFGRAVLWLAPEPVEPFVKLTGMLADQFATAPYDDEFDEVVPHLTVAHASDGVELRPVADRLVAGLPVECRANEVWVMIGDGRVWSVRERYPLA
jgi:2'-5' RNA ligase